MTKTCAIIGCSPLCFSWGFDEEDDVCAALKLLLLNRITKLSSEGYAHFAISIDCGIGLYAAEIIAELQSGNPALEMTLYVPYEEQATKWTAELRERYFNVLAVCKEVVNVSYEKNMGCEFKAHLASLSGADTVIAIYDPDNPNCEREAAAVAVAEMLHKQIFVVNPKLTA